MTTTDVQPTIDTDELSSPIDTQFTNILSTLSQFKTQITAISTHLRTLEKTVKREIKQHKKEVVKKQSKGSSKPSAFAAASPISSELCDFMGKEPGATVARTEVTKFICSYINTNDLTTVENKRVIKPDTKLKMLLGTEEDTVLTYFNIQRFMNKHFIKKEAEQTS